MRANFFVLAVVVAGCVSPAPASTPDEEMPDVGVPVTTPTEGRQASPPAEREDAPTEPYVPVVRVADLPKCRADDALGWHKALNEADTDGTIRFTGREEGEQVHFTVALDEAADMLYVKDSSEGLEVISRGRLVAFLGEEPFLMRQDGISFTQEFIGWTAEEDPTAADTDPFAIPTSWFTPRCEKFRGRDAFFLEYTENGLTERWYFDPETQALLHAQHENRRTDTDLALSYSEHAAIPEIPSAPRIAASFKLELLSEKENDGNYVMKYAVAEGSDKVRYQELEFVFFDENHEEIGRIDARADGKREKDFAAVKIRDVNLQDTTDAGDVWIVTLGPEAYSWDLIDEWARDLALMEFVEDVEDVDEDVELPQAEPTYVQTSTATVTRTFEWEYAGETWTWTLDLPADLYDYYQDRDIVRTNQGVAYDVYVSDPWDDEWIQSLADSLAEAGVQKGWTQDEILSFALSFVQSLPYTQDEVTTGFDEYPRFPIQTLVANGGDCEDTSILFASIALAMGYDTVMVGPPGHMAVGIAAEDDESLGGHRYNGKFYAFAETTGNGYRFGDVPDEYRGMAADIFELSPRAVLNVSWDNGVETEPGYWNMIITATNEGSAAIERAELWGGIHVGNDRYHDADSCRFAEIGPGETVTCTMWLETPPYGSSQFVAIAHGDPAVYERSESTWS